MHLVRLMLNACYSPRLHGSSASLAAITAAFLAGMFSYADAKEGGWDFEAYHIQLNVAIEAPGGIAEQLAADLPHYLRDRIETSLIPMWICDVSFANGADSAKIYA